MFVLFMQLKFMKCFVYIMRGKLWHAVDASGRTLNVNEGSSSPLCLLQLEITGRGPVEPSRTSVLLLLRLA